MIERQSLIPDSVTVLIGENGSGKSLELRRLCLEFLAEDRRVIAIAPSLYDRFQGIRRRKFSFYGGRQGRGAAKRVIRHALQAVSRGKLQVLKQVTQALAYTGFDSAVGIKLIGDHENVFRSAEALGLSDDEQLVSTIRRWAREHDKDGIVRLKLDEHSVGEIASASFAVLANYEDRLRYRGIKLDYFLFREKSPIPLVEACSGELEFITSIAFIAATISPEAVILIDEPETSLHPTWQKNYIKTLLDLFSFYEPRIVISTHSPIIISGSEATTEGTRTPMRVYEMRHRLAHPFQHLGMGLEAMYDQLFGLITPKNHYLSQRAIAILNELGESKRSLRSAIGEIQRLKARSYDKEQEAAIDAIVAMAYKIASSGSVK